MDDHLAGVGGAASMSDAVWSDVGTSGSSPFQATRGWFDRFKKCYSLHNIKITGESTWADHEAAETFPDQLMQLNEENGYVL